ncbi:MAG TPA: hypothetical protein VFR70_06705, partial [Flavobacterium sp.]|nr:hypothetical protein [Flavobacterium sp.]
KEDFFSERLQIPQELVPAFKYYAVESKDLRDAIEAKNKPLSELIMVQLSEKFKKLAADEK